MKKIERKKIPRKKDGHVFPEREIARTVEKEQCIANASLPHRSLGAIVSLRFIPAVLPLSSRGMLGGMWTFIVEFSV